MNRRTLLGLLGSIPAIGFLFKNSQPESSENIFVAPEDGIFEVKYIEPGIRPSYSDENDGEQCCYFGRG